MAGYSSWKTFLLYNSLTSAPRRWCFRWISVLFYSPPISHTRCQSLGSPRIPKLDARVDREIRDSRRKNEREKSALVTRWHRFPRTMPGDPSNTGRISPGTLFRRQNRGRLIDILPAPPDCTIARATSSHNPPYRPSHCTDSINDAINDAYRYITRERNYRKAARGSKLPCTAESVCHGEINWQESGD